MLEPRRVTARLPALALRPLCGELVGYKIRFESLWGPQTRIGYLTYGTALRSFRQRPPGEGDLVVFDEFHERHWESDLLFALLRQRGCRILLMSATLDREGLSQDVPVVESDGRLHPVQVSWEQHDPQLLGDQRKLARLVSQRSCELAAKERGEQLIFLPGMAEIRAAEQILNADSLSGPVQILHSSLDESEIRRVVERPSDLGFRRILSTDLAESSVTLPGVTTVLDSGLRREPLNDSLGLGVSLRTTRAPRASLEQRAGRAGRLGPGRCHRLFTQQDELHRDPFLSSGLAQADQKTVALHLAAWGGLKGWRDLPWLSPPDEQGLEQASRWLEQHDLVDASATLTPRGETVLKATVGPRAALLGALGSEQGVDPARLADWCYAVEIGPPRLETALALNDLLADRNWMKSRDQRLLKRLRETFAAGKARPDSGLLLSAFSDTLAQWRGDRALLQGADQSALAWSVKHPPAEPFGLVLGTAPMGRSDGPASRVTLFAPISSEEIWEHLFESLKEEEHFFWDSDSRSVKGRRKVCLGDLVLEESNLRIQAGPEVASILRQNLRPEQWGEEFRNLLRRLELWAQHRPLELGPPFTGCSAEELPERLLLSYLSTVTNWSRNSPQELLAHAQGVLGYPFLRSLDKELPQTVDLPRRRRPVPVQYPPDGQPFLSSKLQDFFGWKPISLMGGEVPLLFHLLAPNGRPAQITEDLEGFWSGSYAQVGKGLRDRYPKHEWPERP